MRSISEPSLHHRQWYFFTRIVENTPDGHFGKQNYHQDFKRTLCIQFFQMQMNIDDYKKYKL